MAMIAKNTVFSIADGRGSDIVWHTGGVPQFGSAANQAGNIAAFDDWDFAGAGSSHADGAARTRRQEQVWYRHRRTEMLGESARHY
jgi:hypothetical protein